MSQAGQIAVNLLVLAALLPLTIYVASGLQRVPAPVRWLGGWLARRRTPPPPARPIEELANRARVLGHLYRQPAPGIRFAKLEGIRQAYDGVLSDACAALGITHLLGVIPPGPELDAERERVEWALECAGLDLGLPLI